MLEISLCSDGNLRHLYRVERFSRAAKIYGVIADPVRHSISPAVHNRAFQARRLDAAAKSRRAITSGLQTACDEASKVAKSPGRAPTRRRRAGAGMGTRPGVDGGVAI